MIDGGSIGSFLSLMPGCACFDDSNGKRSNSRPMRERYRRRAALPFLLSIFPCASGQQSQRALGIISLDVDNRFDNGWANVELQMAQRSQLRDSLG